MDVSIFGEQLDELLSPMVFILGRTVERTRVPFHARPETVRVFVPYELAYLEWGLELRNIQKARSDPINIRILRQIMSTDVYGYW